MIPICRVCGKPVQGWAWTCPHCGAADPVISSGLDAGFDIVERIISKISDSSHATLIAFALIALIGLLAWAALRFL